MIKPVRNKSALNRGFSEGFSLFEDGFDFFQQFAQIEGFDDVIVDAANVGPRDVLGLAAGGEHNH